MSAESEGSGQDEDNSKEFSIADEKQYNQHRRLKSIHDARDRAREVEHQVLDPDVSIDEQVGNRQYRVAVTDYVKEIEGIAARLVTDVEEVDEDLYEYWFEADLGTVVLYPPDEIMEAFNSDDTRVIGDPDIDPRSWDIVGLHGYLNAPHMFTHEYSIHVRQRHAGKGKFEETAWTEMPIEISEKAFRYASLFLAQIGLDVKIDESEHRVKIDEELIDEVEEWRQENLQ